MEQNATAYFHSHQRVVWIAIGSPAVEICNATNEDVDLITISTHGRTGLGHLLIGSIAEHMVRYARCLCWSFPRALGQTRLKSSDKK
jgi:nucleotide-binding universal stress UspA family protein